MILAVIQAVSEQSTVVLMNRALIAIITLLVTVVAYFLKQVADDIKSTRATVAKHSEIIARHSVMYDVWIDEMAAENPDDMPRRRRSDVLRDILAGAAKVDASATKP